MFLYNANEMRNIFRKKKKTVFYYFRWYLDQCFQEKRKYMYIIGRAWLFEQTTGTLWLSCMRFRQMNMRPWLRSPPGRAPENWKNNRSGPKLRILDRFQTPQNAINSVQQVCVLNPIFPHPTNFQESMMSKKSQTVKSSKTDNVRAPFKCDITVVKRL